MTKGGQIISEHGTGGTHLIEQNSELLLLGARLTTTQNRSPKELLNTSDNHEDY
ncbi:unnamed protein product [marine sediment metagenome]|uniref:Uncharacterized protein n=1 Tax=marine sediment metagenome TaxID=412755 RepID=X1MWK6_9ZZZZ